MTLQAKKISKSANEVAVTDICSGFYNSALGFGQTVGPILGAYMNKEIGFRRTQEFVATLYVLYTLLYLTMAGGLKAFGSVKKSSYSDYMVS